MSERVSTTIVRALVGNEYVPGYQVCVHRYTVAPNGVTLLSSHAERVPSDRGVSLDEACDLSSQIEAGPVSELERTVQRFAHQAAPDLSTAMRRAAEQQRRQRAAEERVDQHRAELSTYSESALRGFAIAKGIRGDSPAELLERLAKSLAANELAAEWANEELDAEDELVAGAGA